jgi:hypothetical protein
MILLASILAVLAAAFAAKAAILTESLRAARAELAATKRRLVPPAPPSPPRQYECRIERYGLLWFPVLTADDGEKVVVGVSSGLPCCVRCVAPLKLVAGLEEEWVCGGCGKRHPAMSADLTATDTVLTDCLRDFFARHPDFSPAPGLSAPKLDPVEVA